MPRTAIVTGGGTGIGRAIAQRLASDGAEVIITGRRSDVLHHTATTLPGSVHAYPLDATDPHAVAAFAHHVTETDVLVNNAGANTDFDTPPPEDLDTLAKSWQRNLTNNLFTALLMTEALLPTMRRGASIVSLGSIAADQGAGAYGAAKAALASWNRDLARRVATREITANLVAPGYVADTEFFRDVLTDDLREHLTTAAMTRRATTPTDIADTVAFLTHPTTTQLTAQTIAVNGGQTP